MGQRPPARRHRTRGLGLHADRGGEPPLCPSGGRIGATRRGLHDPRRAELRALEGDREHPLVRPGAEGVLKAKATARGADWGTFAARRSSVADSEGVQRPRGVRRPRSLSPRLPPAKHGCSAPRSELKGELEAEGAAGWLRRQSDDVDHDKHNDQDQKDRSDADVHATSLCLSRSTTYDGGRGLWLEGQRGSGVGRLRCSVSHGRWITHASPTARRPSRGTCTGGPGSPSGRRG
jgi:hypothetical protein